MSSIRYYKVLSQAEFDQASKIGSFVGCGIDIQDGFIHLSTASQVVETVQKYFAEQRDLVLVEVDGEALAETIRLEPSRGGALFPHVYGEIPTTAFQRHWPLPWSEELAAHQFPSDL